MTSKAASQQRDAIEAGHKAISERGPTVKADLRDNVRGRNE
jgi:hypothetical protein